MKHPPNQAASSNHPTGWPHTSPAHCADPALRHLENQLRQRGLPAAYIAHMLAELDDHIEDLIAERRQSMDGQSPSRDEAWRHVGTAEHLADAACLQYQQRHFATRHPLLTFLLLPVIALLAGWIGMIYLMVFADSIIDRFASDWRSTDASVTTVSAGHLLGHLYIAAFNILPPLAVACGSVLLARRRGVSGRWAIAACGLVALLALLVAAQIDIQPGPGNSKLMVGAGFPPSTSRILQAALTLLAAWSVWKRLPGAVASDVSADTTPAPLRRAA